jgi:Fe-S oxidoreductase
MTKYKVYTMAEYASMEENPEVLFWVGCAGSFDARAQKVTEAFCKILWNAGVKFAILGKEEACTGDPARRAGNEFVFQMLALQNIETLKMYAVKKIVTTCPHCMNSLKNEYPELGEVSYEVVHHTQFLEELIKDNRLKFTEKEELKITYHDSCYLGRINGEYQAPRAILKEIYGDVTEMTRAKENGLCCGAGGAQMFKEDEPGNERINIERTEEALATGASTIAVNCPFCLTMFDDGLKAKEKQEEVMAYDLAELIVQNKKW